jgi:hypothetical protein
MSTERFVKALCEYDLNPTEIADILWLASRQLSVNSQLATSETSQISTDSTTVVKNSSLDSSDFSSDTDNQTDQKQANKPFGIAPQPAVGALPAKALPIAIPDADFLNETLPLVRALRPLLKRVASTTTSRVNEAATVDRIAETDIWLPVMQADREPWFEVVVVIDRSAGMTLWQRLIADIQKLLRCYGSFRDLRIYDLVYAQGKIGLQSGSDRSIRSPKELLTAEGRRITIIFSDCTADYWWNGAMQPVLTSWGTAMPTVIWQVLPDWMWKRTALGAGEYVSIRNRIPGANNQELQATFLALRPSNRRQKPGADHLAVLSICLPVISTDR